MSDAGETDDGRQPRGWARRLIGYAWRYRRNVLLSLGSSLAGMAVMALVPLITKVIIDDVVGNHTRSLAVWTGLLVGAAALVYVSTYIRRYYGGRLRPGRPARPADRDLRDDHPPRRQAAGRALHRTGRRARHQRPPADPGAAVHAPDDHRERAALPALPGDHGVALAAADPRRRGRRPRALVHRPPLPHPALPRHLVRPVAGRGRGRSRRRGRLRRPRRQGVRAGGPGDRQAARGRTASSSPGGCAPSG